MSQPCQQQNSEESDHFRRQERQPDAVQPKQARQCDSAGDDSDGPAQQRTGDGWFWLRDGGKIGNQQDVDASKEKAQEIQPEPTVGVMQKFGVLLLVEDLDQWIGHAPGQHQNERFHDQAGDDAPGQELAALRVIAFSVAFADERLRALRESVEQAHGNDGEIGSDAVSGDTDISGESQKQEIKDDRDHGGGYFADKGGYAELAAGDQVAQGWSAKTESDLIVFSQVVRAADAHRHKRAECRR